MSKSSKDRPIVPPKSPPVNELPNGNPPPSIDPLVIELVHVALHVLREVREGESVTVRWEENPVIVTTLVGIRIGDVKTEDSARIKQNKSSQGLIAKIEVETGQCFVGVL